MTDLAALEARLQRAEDLLEINRLYLDYGRHLDHQDFGAYAALFARDGKLRLGPFRGDGPADIERAAVEYLGGRPPMSMVHLISTPRIELDGDTATGEGMWVVAGPAEGGGVQVTTVGRHLDELVREDGRWRFALRRGAFDVT